MNKCEPDILCANVLSPRRVDDNIHAFLSYIFSNVIAPKAVVFVAKANYASSSACDGDPFSYRGFDLVFSMLVKQAIARFENQSLFLVCTGCFRQTRFRRLLQKTPLLNGADHALASLPQQSCTVMPAPCDEQSMV